MMAATCSQVFLKHGVTQAELEKGTEIEIDPDTYLSSEEEEYFENEISNGFEEKFYKYTLGDTEKAVNISTLSIAELKQKMKPLTDDGLVLKLELSAGSGIIIPPKSIVLMHYNGFIEGQKQPFDSTYKRGSPFKFLLNGGKIVFGLDKAVSTMRKGEISKLWIHYNYAFGPFGCPPRIPNCSNIMYDIEILNYFDCKDAVEFEEMLPDDQQIAPFDKVVGVCKVEHVIGNELFKSRKYIASAHRYLRAIKLLETVNVADEVEDKKRDALLLKLYLNISMCYIQLKRANRALTFAHKAIFLDEHNTKALYRLGQAYKLANDFEKSRQYFLKAQKLEPYNEDINNALLKLEEHQRKYTNWNKDFCQRMFQWNSKNEHDKILSQESSEFVDTIKNKIEELKASNNNEYTFPSMFTQSQIEVVKAIAESQELYFFEKIHNGNKIIKVKKASNDVKKN